MNTDMIGGVIRAVLPPVIAYLVGRGVLPSGNYGSVITGFVALLTAVWSVRTNATGKIIK